MLSGERRGSARIPRIVERLSDTPAIVLSRFGEALLQSRSAVALFGDYTRFTGMSHVTLPAGASLPGLR